jgi:hypothetical protein
MKLKVTVVFLLNYEMWWFVTRHARLSNRQTTLPGILQELFIGA